MTGVDGSGEASLLLPPCPRQTAEAVLFDLTSPAVGEELTRHGRAAVRRRWTRALALPAVAAVAAVWWHAPVWVWVALAALAVACAFLGFDRARALGHRVGDGWLVAQSGSLDRRRDCIAAAGVIGWTVRQSWFQRRAGVATLVAATAAGVKGYRVLDVPAELAWSVAAEATPWVGRTEWAR
jgi:putative membrane protein